MTSFQTTLFTCMAAAVLASCVKDKFEIEEINSNAEPVFGMPIGGARITSEELVNRFDSEGIVQTGATGMLSVLYRDTLQELRAEDFFSLDDQNKNQTFELSPAQIAALNAAGSITIATSEPFVFGSDSGDRLDSLRIKSGFSSLSFSSAGGFPITGSIELRSGDGTDVILSMPFEDLQPPINFTTTESLENALLEFSHDTDADNVLVLETEITFSSHPDAVAAPVEMVFGMNEMEMKTVGGYLTPRDLPILGEGIDITLFDDLPAGEFIIEDPRIHLFGENGFGFGLALDIDAIFASDKNGAALFIPGEQIERLADVLPATTPESSSTWMASITNETISPTLTEIMAFKPNFMSGDFNLSLNPDNVVSGFLTDESAFNPIFELEIPVYGSIIDYTSSDTTEVSLGDLVSDIEDISEIESLDFRVFVDNGFPVDMLAQIVFLDENDVPIDSLFDELSDVFASAPVDLSVPPEDPNFGRPVGSTSVIKDISFPRERIEQLDAAVSMVIRVRGNTTSNGDHPIRLFAEDFFDIQLSAKTQISFQ